jgi:hypothetical protein
MAETIAREAARTGRIIGVRFSTVEDEEQLAPWMARPARHETASFFI